MDTFSRSKELLHTRLAVSQDSCKFALGIGTPHRAPDSTQRAKYRGYPTDRIQALQSVHIASFAFRLLAPRNTLRYNHHTDTESGRTSVATALVSYAHMTRDYGWYELSDGCCRLCHGPFEVPCLCASRAAFEVPQYPYHT